LQRRLVLILLTGRALVVLRFDALRGIPTRERQRIGGVWRRLQRLRSPVFVRERRTLRWLQRLHVDARLDEHEPLILLRAQRLFERGATPRELLGRHLEHWQLRHEEDGENQESVADDRKNDAFAARDGAADEQLVFVAIVDVEMNQRDVS